VISRKSTPTLKLRRGYEYEHCSRSRAGRPLRHPRRSAMVARGFPFTADAGRARAAPARGCQAGRPTQALAGMERRRDERPPSGSARGLSRCRRLCSSRQNGCGPPRTRGPGNRGSRPYQEEVEDLTEEPARPAPDIPAPPCRAQRRGPVSRSLPRHPARTPRRRRVWARVEDPSPPALGPLTFVDMRVRRCGGAAGAP